MTPSEKLRAADWEVRDLSDRIELRRAGNTADGFATIMKNPDGTLHFVLTRSAFHREIAAIVNAPDAPTGEYTPRAYGS